MWDGSKDPASGYEIPKRARSPRCGMRPTIVQSDEGRRTRGAQADRCGGGLTERGEEPQRRRRPEAAKFGRSDRRISGGRSEPAGATGTGKERRSSRGHSECRNGADRAACRASGICRRSLVGRDSCESNVGSGVRADIVRASERDRNSPKTKVLPWFIGK